MHQPGFHVDHRYEFHAIKRLTEQWKNVLPSMQASLAQKFKLDKTLDFYHGMLAGIMASVSYKTNAVPVLSEKDYVEFLKILPVFIAKNLQEKIEESEG